MMSGPGENRLAFYGRTGGRRAIILRIMLMKRNYMSPVVLDKTDRKILSLLQADGRMTNAELAQRINLSPSACLRRVQRLEESAVIAGYVALVRQEAVGRPTSIFVEVTLESQSEE